MLSELFKNLCDELQQEDSAHFLNPFPDSLSNVSKFQTTHGTSSSAPYYPNPSNHQEFSNCYTDETVGTVEEAQVE